MPVPLLNLLARGESQASRLLGQLLASERFVAVVQEVVSRTLAARGTLDRSLKAALSTMSVPSTSDVEDLRRRLDDLDRLLTDLDGKMGRIEERLAAPRGPAAAPRKTRRAG